MAARLPASVESTAKPRVLLAAFAEAPSASAEGVRAEQLLLGFSCSLEFDALTLKGSKLTHIQRIGAARMMRVPVPEGASGEAGRATFLDRLGAFRRALARQLDAERYDVVLCLDLFSAAAALPGLSGARLVVEVADVPSLSFDKRWPVAPTDADTRKQWERGERAAFKAASLLLVPSRQAARALSERADPRIIRTAPRLVDTRIFQPPTVELALDESRTIAFLGGRESSRSVQLTAMVQALARRLPDVRLLVLGAPGRADGALQGALAEQGLLERVVLVDVNAPHERAQALSAAHVVVVPAGGDGDGWGLPHRVLEAMACARAVIVTGTEAAYKDAITNGVHAHIVAPGAVDDVAVLAERLLRDDDARQALARAGRKQALRFELASRLPELGATLQEGTGIPFVAALPPLEEVTAPAPVARAVPVTPAPSPLPAASPPPASAVTASLPPEISESGDRPAPNRAGVLHGNAGSDPRPGDVWVGDTVLDTGDVLRHAPSEPAPERVKAAMLHTQSGERERLKTVSEAAAPSTRRSARTMPPRSVALAMADALDGDDDWSRDTIADASPLAEPTRNPTAERAANTHPPRSLLVEIGVGDVTAEDKPANSGSE